MTSPFIHGSSYQITLGLGIYSLPSTEHLHIQRSFESDPDISLSSLIGYYTAALSPDVYLLADLVMVSRPVSA